jgi:hypothetical protein
MHWLTENRQHGNPHGTWACQPGVRRSPATSLYIPVTCPECLAAMKPNLMRRRSAELIAFRVTGKRWYIGPGEGWQPASMSPGDFKDQVKDDG